MFQANGAHALFSSSPSSYPSLRKNHRNTLADAATLAYIKQMASVFCTGAWDQVCADVLLSHICDSSAPSALFAKSIKSKFIDDVCQSHVALRIRAHPHSTTWHTWIMTRTLYRELMRYMDGGTVYPFTAISEENGELYSASWDDMVLNVDDGGATLYSLAEPTPSKPLWDTVRCFLSAPFVMYWLHATWHTKRDGDERLLQQLTTTQGMIESIADIIRQYKLHHVDYRYVDLDTLHPPINQDAWIRQLHKYMREQIEDSKVPDKRLKRKYSQQCIDDFTNYPDAKRTKLNNL